MNLRILLARRISKRLAREARVVSSRLARPSAPRNLANSQARNPLTGLASLRGLVGGYLERHPDPCRGLASSRAPARFPQKSTPKHLPLLNQLIQRIRSHVGDQIHTYAELRVQIREALRRQHPEWIDANGKSPPVRLLRSPFRQVARSYSQPHESAPQLESRQWNAGKEGFALFGTCLRIAVVGVEWAIIAERPSHRGFTPISDASLDVRNFIPPSTPDPIQ